MYRLIVRSKAKRTAQRRDRLLEAVVGDGHIAPGHVDEGVLGHDGSGVADEVFEDVEVAVGHGNRSAVAGQAAGARIELEWSKRIDGPGRHRAILGDSH